MTTTGTKGTKRPITTALNIVKRMGWMLSTRDREYRTLSLRSHARLLAILTAPNAASGTTDARSAAKRARTIRRNAKKNAARR